MHKGIIIKLAIVVSTLIALNAALGLFGYGMALPNWVMYISLAANIIVLLAFAVGIVMHDGHGCYMCCHDGHDHKGCGCDKPNCK